MLMTGVMQTQMLKGQKEAAYNTFRKMDPTPSTGVGEYLIDGTSAYETIWAQPKPGSDDLHLLSYEKQGGKAYLEVENDGEAADILKGLGVMGEGSSIASGIGKTYELVQKGYDDFLSSKLDAIKASKEPPKTQA